MQRGFQIALLITAILEMLSFLFAAGLHLFAKHSAQFKEYIAKDYEVSIYLKF